MFRDFGEQFESGAVYHRPQSSKLPADPVAVTQQSKMQPGSGSNRERIIQPPSPHHITLSICQQLAAFNRQTVGYSGSGFPWVSGASQITKRPTIYTRLIVLQAAG